MPQAAVAQVASARKVYAERRALLVGALGRLGVYVAGSEGINIWVPVENATAAVVRLASQGIGVSAGAPFAVLPTHQSHIRVTAGLVRDHHATLAGQIAAAAQTASWSARAR